MYDPQWSDSAVRRFSAHIGDLVLIYCVSRGRTSRASVLGPEDAPFRLEELKSRIQQVAEIDQNKAGTAEGLWASHY